MSGIKIGFSVSPWLLLMIIPALAAIIAVFFMGRRRNRCTANRVISASLQSVVAVMLILALSGIYFYTENTNAQNELVILVDRSFTTREPEEEMDEFVREVLEENGGRCKTAIVLFGYDRKVALEMGDYTAEEAYKTYLAALETDPVDSRATNLAGAVRLAYDSAEKSENLIAHPETAKILIISDGLQTDEDAMGAIKNATRDGVRVDVAFYAAQTAADASVTGITFPDKNIRDNEEFDFNVNIKSDFERKAVIFLEDKNERGEILTKSSEVSLKLGAQTLSFPYSFELPGWHEIVFRLEVSGDSVSENNTYYSYYNVLKKNRLLILEKFGGESAKLKALAEEDSKSQNTEIQTMTIENASSMTARDMEKFSEIVLYNIAEGDMTEDFQKNLYEYSRELGGGVLTVGGFEKDSEGKVVQRPKERDPQTTVPQAHSYKEEDFSSALYSSMLPVTYDPYKPSVGVVFVIDASSSMTSVTKTAIKDAKHSLNILSKNDYVGVIVLKDSYQQLTGNEMIPMTQRDKIEKAIEEVENSKGVSTYYEPAMQQAVNMLKICPPDVVKKHIVLMSDAAPGDYFEEYASIIEEAHLTQNVTITVMSYYEHKREIDGKTYYFNNSAYNDPKNAMNQTHMDALAAMGGGSSVFTPRTATYSLDKPFAEDLKLEELEEVGMHEFHPQKGKPSAVTAGVTDTQIQSLLLKGFFPTRAKMEEGVEQLIMADASPLYAQWKFGKGKVGSLMIDLEGVWSNDLLENETGKKIIQNILSELFMRVEEVQTSLEMNIVEDNFHTRVSVYGFDPEKEPNAKLIAFVTPPDGSDGEVAKFDLSNLSSTHNKFSFENLSPGTYAVYVLKVSSNFDVMSENVKGIADVPDWAKIEVCGGYRTFSYSGEYDRTMNAYKEGQEFLASLSTRATDGDILYDKFIYDPAEIYNNYSLVKNVIDPRTAFMISAIVIYLAGIALRKFKIPKTAHKKAVAANS